MDDCWDPGSAIPRRPVRGTGWPPRPTVPRAGRAGRRRCDRTPQRCVLTCRYPGSPPPRRAAGPAGSLDDPPPSEKRLLPSDGKLLDAVIEGIGDVQVAFAVESYAVRSVELARLGPLLAETPQE